MQRLSKLSLIGPFTPGASVLSHAESVRAARANCCLSAIHWALICSHCDGPVRQLNTHPSSNSWTEAPPHSSKVSVNRTLQFSQSQSAECVPQVTRAKKPQLNLHPYAFCTLSTLSLQCEGTTSLTHNWKCTGARKKTSASVHLMNLNFAADVQYVITAVVIFHQPSWGGGLPLSHQFCKVRRFLQSKDTLLSERWGCHNSRHLTLQFRAWEEQPASQFSTCKL